MLGRWRGPGAVVAGCLAIRSLIWAGGTRFSFTFPAVGDTAWQLLDLEVLRDRPLAPLWDLHTQPPLFNLVTGLVLRLSPLPDHRSFQLLYVLLGLAAALALYGILTGLGCRWWIAAAVSVVVFSDPTLLQYENLLTYETPITALVLGTTWACLRYAQNPTTRRLALFVGLATALVLTRALFHPLWLVVVMGLVLWVRRPRADRRHVFVLLAVPLVLVGGLMAKNQARFGTFSFSSWFGMNLDRMVVGTLPAGERDELIADGTISQQARVTPFAPYEEFAPVAAAACDAAGGRGPALSAASKADGKPNFNYECYLPVYEQAQEDAVAVIRHRPGAYAEMVRAATVTYFSDENLVSAAASDEDLTIRTLDRVHDTLALETGVTAWYREMPLPMRVHPTAFVATLGLIGAGIWSARRAWRGDRSVAVVVLLFVGVTVAYTTAAGTLFEAWENARFRLPLDPLLFGAPLALLGEAAARRVSVAVGGEAAAVVDVPADVDLDDPVVDGPEDAAAVDGDSEGRPARAHGVG